MNFKLPSLKLHSLKVLIISGIVLVLLIGGGTFAYYRFAPGRGKNGKKAPKPKKVGTVPGPIFDMDTFIVNLMDNSGRRYLKITIKLELSEEKLAEELTQKMIEIRDNILLLLSSKTYDAIADISGKLRLRTEIISRLNKILTIGKVRKVYFTDFVIQ